MPGPVFSVKYINPSQGYEICYPFAVRRENTEYLYLAKYRWVQVIDVEVEEDGERVA
jgi:hypothetical protein